MYLAGKNSIGDVLPNIDQLALVSYFKAMTIQHIQWRCPTACHDGRGGGIGGIARCSLKLT